MLYIHITHKIKTFLIPYKIFYYVKTNINKYAEKLPLKHKATKEEAHLSNIEL